MKSKKAFYSLIQYCPDFSRHETVNVGVILLVPVDRIIAVRTSKNNSRVRKFFGQGGFDNASLNFAKSSIQNRLLAEQHRLAVLEEFEKFAKSRGNNLLITQPRPAKVVEPRQEVDRLFRELVMQTKESGREPVFPLLDRSLRRPQFEKRIEYNVHVTIPIVGRKLQVPYAFRNGAHNLVKPQLFAHDAMATGMQLALEGDLIQGCPENGTSRKLIVIPKIEMASAQKTRNSLSDLFNRYSIRTVWEEDLGNFAEEVDQQARAIEV